MPQTLGLPTPALFLTSKQKGTDTRTINVNLDRGIFFPEVERIYCTLSQASIPYAMQNINQRVYGNACFQVQYDSNPGTWYNIVLDDGTYPSLTELEQAMNYVLSQTRPSSAVFFPSFDIDDRDTYFIHLDGNTTTSEISVTLRNPTNINEAPVFENPVQLISFTCFGSNPVNGEAVPLGTEPSGLFQELGFLGGEQLDILTNPNGDQLVSTQPVTFLDYIASGIYVIVEDDLQVLTFFNDFANSNVLAQIVINNDDFLGGLILYPRDLQTIECPVVENKTLRNFKIRFVSPRDPTRDIIFTQGDVSLVLTFTAVY